MPRLNRREFLNKSKRTTLGLAAGVTILQNAKSVRGAPAADKLSLALVGIRGRGHHLATGFLDRDDCELSYLCDVDESQFPPRVKEYTERQGREPKCVGDFREALDDKSVDAIVVATPDHWHGPAAIMGCQAGKDVYVEKPACHNPWEGQKMVEAARKYDRVMQVGMQNRSAPYNMAAKKFIEDGGLGNVHLCRVFNMKSQGNPKLGPNTDPPAGLDWNMWQGPAPLRPYNAAIHRSGWHHFWDYAGGDLANDGVHQLDLARWLVGVDVPKAAHCTGGRFEKDGDAESPDTQIATFDFDDLIMTAELTLYTPYILKTDPEVRDTDMFPYWLQNATRIEIYGTDGMMVMGRHGGGWQTFIRPKSRQPVVGEQMYGRFPDPEHKENFVQCIRNRERPNADILEGHRSALLVHYANISYRTGGQNLVIDPTTDKITNSDSAMGLFKRKYRKAWAVPEVV